MVRVISEKLFSPPRSRHSSGETVDKELAARAVEALSGLNSRRLEFSDYESSSDSHWDSEVDLDGDGPETPKSEQTADEDGVSQPRDVVRKRKERRRERNKLSAQAYRLRQREQSVKRQNVLASLQDDNTRLKTQVKYLEDQLQKVRQVVRHRQTIPTTAIPTTTSTASLAASAPVLSSPPFPSPCSGMMSFSQLAKREPGAPHHPHHHHHETSVDNARQQVSPVLDNFRARRPSPTLSLPLTTPPASPSCFTSSPPSPATTPTPTPTSALAGFQFGKVPEVQADLNANAVARNANSPASQLCLQMRVSNAAFGGQCLNVANVNDNNNVQKNQQHFLLSADMTGGTSSRVMMAQGAFNIPSA